MKLFISRFVSVSIILLLYEAFGKEHCSIDVMRRIQSSLTSIRNDTACPDASWKVEFFRTPVIQKSDLPVVIFDVGCNKGYDALSSLNLFSQDYSVTTQQWAAQTEFPCGVCGQCAQDAQAPDPALQGKQVRLFCIEPLPANIKRLKAAAKAFKLADRGMTVLHAAATSLPDAVAKSWKAPFPKDMSIAGFEAFGIDGCAGCRKNKNIGAKKVSVPLMVLDKFVTNNKIDHIDILSIDTEGNDPLVLQGAADILDRTRYVEFEYHRFGVWAHTNLSTVVDMLDEKGFVCYWLGVKKLWRLTGCWDDRYNVHDWSNIGCVKESEKEWFAIMENTFSQTLHFPHKN